MVNSRELAKLLCKAQDLHSAETQPQLWMLTEKYEGEETPKPPYGVAVFTPGLDFSLMFLGLKMTPANPPANSAHSSEVLAQCLDLGMELNLTE